jgi:hypothetical protein
LQLELDRWVLWIMITGKVTQEVKLDALQVTTLPETQPLPRASGFAEG